MSPRLSIYERMAILTALFAITFVVFGLASYYVNQAFASLAIGGPIICGLLMTLAKCPRCGWPILKKRTRTFTYWGGSIPGACQQCGLSFKGVE
jgi:hypothetical protein